MTKITNDSSREDIEDYQLGYINEGLERVHQLSPYYKSALADFPRTLESLHDLKDLPFTTKDDIRDNEKGFLTAPLNEIQRFHTSSGENPTTSFYTNHDLHLLDLLLARIFQQTGFKNGPVNNSFNYGLFTGGLAFQHILDNMGVSVIPGGNANPEAQLKLLMNYRANSLLATPTGANNLIETALDGGIDLSSKDICHSLIGGEFLSYQMKQRLIKGTGGGVFGIYGASELIGPGIAHECSGGSTCGYHIQEDAFIAEIVHPESSEIMREGELGELVITMFRDATSLIRYRTGDITYLYKDECDNCGKTFARTGSIIRKNDFLWDRVNSAGQIGDKLSVEDVENSILANGGIPHYVIYPDMDKMLLETNFKTKTETDKFIKCLRDFLHNETKKDIEIVLMEYKSLPRTMGKGKHVAWGYSGD